MNFAKPGNEKGKCPSCWPPIAQKVIVTKNDISMKEKEKEKRNKHLVAI